MVGFKHANPFTKVVLYIGRQTITLHLFNGLRPVTGIANEMPLKV